MLRLGGGVGRVVGLGRLAGVCGVIGLDRIDGGFVHTDSIRGPVANVDVPRIRGAGAVDEGVRGGVHRGA